MCSGGRSSARSRPPSREGAGAGEPRAAEPPRAQPGAGPPGQSGRQRRAAAPRGLRVRPAAGAGAGSCGRRAPRVRFVRVEASVSTAVGEAGVACPAVPGGHRRALPLMSTRGSLGVALSCINSKLRMVSWSRGSSKSCDFGRG